MATYEQVGLWQRAFRETGAPFTDAALDRLTVAYRQFWKNAVTLADQIQKSVPGLTLHDEAHFDALWARADQIAGPNFSLSPLELFVLGGAILVHDNANSVAAFAGGLDDVKGTPEWADAEAEWRERQPEGSSDAELSESAHIAILLDTLRAIHAERAETLAELEVDVDGSKLRLLSDDGLRRHLGELIGLVAASHHWDVRSLSNQLPGTQGSLAGMPDQWVVRPILVALLLRCADAVQLDQSRAPDFLFGLLRIKGLSAEHWRAQNRLATPVIDPADPEALLFTSTRSFKEEAADAWWIAYEALHMASGELQAADALLRDLRLPPFTVRRISGADSPLRLSEHVRVQGWQPVEAEVKITDVAKVVGTFGGEQLYGRDYSVPLRELIQNAADAVRLRRRLEPADSGYSGRIVVRLLDGDSEQSSVIVEDDGIGMSTAVLTGPLIDFGGSYLSSTIVKREHPGLRAAAPHRIGKYGIGFFSSFMLADEIRISSRPFESGVDAVRTLLFKRGIFDRPLLLEQRPEGFGPLVSTRIALKVSQEKLRLVLQFPGGMAENRPTLSIEQLVGMLCPMLDVDVYVDSGTGAKLIHGAQWFNEDRRAWLQRILVPEAAGSPYVQDLIDVCAGRLTFLDLNDPAAGLAAIVTGAAGVNTVGALRASFLFNRYADGFIGAIDHEPGGPRREAGKPRAKSLLASWATQQAMLIANSLPSFPTRQHLAEIVSAYGGDSSPLFGLQLNGEWIDLEAIVDKLLVGETLYAPLKAGFKGEAKLARVRERHSGFIDNYQQDELKYLLPTLEATDGSRDAIYELPEADTPDDRSFFEIIGRRAASRGFLLHAEGVADIEFAEYVGQPSPREGLFVGKKIKTAGLKLWATPFAAH